MRFKIAIGDWSDDGHGKCEYVFVDCNSDSIENVREDYFSIYEKFGINLSEICSDYGDYQISNEILKDIQDLGFVDDELQQVDNEDDESGNFYDSQYMSVELMSKIIVFMLNKSNPELNAVIVDDNIPMLQFYGFDEKRRHLSVGGYGLFD